MMARSIRTGNVSSTLGMIFMCDKIHSPDRYPAIQDTSFPLSLRPVDLSALSQQCDCESLQTFAKMRLTVCERRLFCLFSLSHLSNRRLAEGRGSASFTTVPSLFADSFEWWTIGEG